LFGFLTTEANAVVGTIHPKTMPVILTTTTPAGQTLKLQQLLANGTLKIVAIGERKDEAV
jgi:putative SOS response-associated peptidase YedK